MARGVEREATLTDEDDREAPAATEALSRASPDYISIALMPSVSFFFFDNSHESKFSVLV